MVDVMKKYGVKQKKLIPYFLMLTPGFLWLIFFNIIPMSGIYMAFTDFNPGLGIFKSPFVGLDNFEYMFELDDVRQVFLNTLYLSLIHI